MLNETGSHISFAKEKEVRMAVDALSAHSGSLIADVNAMQIDDAQSDVASMHVQFDLDASAQSVDGSVATVALKQAANEQITPPTSPRLASANAKGNAVTVANKKKKKKLKKAKKKKRFAADKQIEYERDELIESDMTNAAFLHPTGRDCLHIWREQPLSSLGFEGMLRQPLSKELFGKFGANVSQHFALCNAEETGKAVVDSLNNLDLDVEKGRDYGSDEAVHDEEEHDVAMPMGMEMRMDIDGMNDLSAANLNELNEAPPIALDDDNASTLDSVCNDALPAPQDPLFDDEPLLDMDMDQSANHLSFDTNDENVLTQMPDGHQEEEEQEQGNGIKPRD